MRRKKLCRKSSAGRGADCIRNVAEAVKNRLAHVFLYIMHSFYKRTPSGRPPQPCTERQKYFTKPELFFPKPLIVFTIRQKKFVTNLLTYIRNFVTRITNFVTHITNFLIKNIIYGSKKFLVEKKKYLGGSKISLRDIYVASRFDVLRAAALEFLARALYAPSILPRACVGVTP